MLKIGTHVEVIKKGKKKDLTGLRSKIIQCGTYQDFMCTCSYCGSRNCYKLENVGPLLFCGCCLKPIEPDTEPCNLSFADVIKGLRSEQLTK